MENIGIEKYSLKKIHQISMLSVNTKARRIGYFQLLGKFLRQKSSIPKSILSKEFELFCKNFNKNLFEYKNSKGLIKVTKQGTSAKPYIDLSNKLSLLSINNNIYTPSKQFLVVLKCDFLELKKNPFVVTGLYKMHFFEKFLGKDFFLIRIILECIYYNGIKSYQEMKSIYYNFLLERIIEINNSLTTRELIKDNLKIEKRIKSWENPEKYLEHVLMPRLNWLLDLSLIDFDEHINFNKTQEGMRFINHIGLWDLKTNATVVNCSEIIQYDYMNMYSKIYNKRVDAFTFEKKDTVIELINESFEIFKTIAPNRVTLSQAINFIRYNLYWKDNIITEFVEINHFIKEHLDHLYLYRYLPYQNEGYLQKK